MSCVSDVYFKSLLALALDGAVVAVRALLDAFIVDRYYRRVSPLSRHLAL